MAAKVGLLARQCCSECSVLLLCCPKLCFRKQRRRLFTVCMILVIAIQCGILHYLVTSSDMYLKGQTGDLPGERSVVLTTGRGKQVESAVEEMTVNVSRSLNSGILLSVIIHHGDSVNRRARGHARACVCVIFFGGGGGLNNFFFSSDFNANYGWAMHLIYKRCKADGSLSHTHHTTHRHTHY